SQNGRVVSLAFSPDGLWLATAGYPAGVRLYDVASGRLLRTCGAAEREGSNVVRFSPGGKSLVAGARNGKVVRIWDSTTGEAPGPISTDRLYHISQLAFSRDGRRLAIGGHSPGRALCVVDWRTKQELFPPVAPRAPISRLVYSPDGAQLISGSTDSQICVW